MAMPSTQLADPQRVTVIAIAVIAIARPSPMGPSPGALEIQLNFKLLKFQANPDLFVSRKMIFVAKTRQDAALCRAQNFN